MNAKPVIVLLIILCVALGGVLLYGLKKTSTEMQDLQLKLVDRSNNWVQASSQLHDEQNTNKVLRETLNQRVEEIQTLTAKLDEMDTKVTKSAAAAATAATAAQAAQDEVKKRDAKIAELEAQRDDLTKRMTELNTSITDLESKITDTEKKLAASEGDRAFLLKELKRLQAEKAELERQFSNVAFLREQVRKLRDEMSIAKRLDWFRRGVYGTTEKGAEKLQKGFVGVTNGQTNFNLDVELHQDGSVKVNPPATNTVPTPQR